MRDPSDQIRSVTQSRPTLCDPMNRSTPGLPVHHQLLEFIQTHAHQVSDAIQPSHPLSSPSPPAPNPSQHHSSIVILFSYNAFPRITPNAFCSFTSFTSLILEIPPLAMIFALFREQTFDK